MSADADNTDEMDLEKKLGSPARTVGPALKRVYTLERERDVIGLVRMLDNPLGRGSVSVRGAAASALGRLADPRAGTALMASLDDASEEVRYSAVRAVGLVKHTDAVAALVRALDDEALSVRQVAAFSLGELRQAAAIKPLHAVLGSSDPWTRFYAAEALAKIGDPSISQLLPELARRDNRLAFSRQRRWRSLAAKLRRHPEHWPSRPID